MIGYLNGVSFDGAFAAQQKLAIRQGLREVGYVEGQNVAIEYRSADGHYDRLPSLAADLVSRQVALIIAVGSTNSPQAAKAATSRIPVVFAVGSDPVDTGLVTNLSRPEANLTGVTFNSTALAPKRLEIVMPDKISIGYLKNPTNRFDTDLVGLMAAAKALGAKISVFEASTDRELLSAFLSAFDSMAQRDVAALILTVAATGARTHRRVRTRFHKPRDQRGIPGSGRSTPKGMRSDREIVGRIGTLRRLATVLGNRQRTFGMGLGINRGPPQSITQNATAARR